MPEPVPRSELSDACIRSCIVVCGFCAMWLVANELEDPFGSDPNDLPMIGYHEHFVVTLRQMLEFAWTSQDDWLEDSGTHWGASGTWASGDSTDGVPPPATPKGKGGGTSKKDVEAYEA